MCAGSCARVVSARAVFAVALAAVGSVHAQGAAVRTVCNSHGSNWNEPIGDRDGHTVQVAEGNCTVQGGPFDGAVLTQQTIWEFDKGSGTMLSSQGVYRKPGAMGAYVNSAGTLTFQIVDGKVTGWSASGKGRIALATGSAASYAGRTYSWIARPNGNRSYIVEATYD
jgi:hypothetical protein